MKIKSEDCFYNILCLSKVKGMNMSINMKMQVKLDQLMENLHVYLNIVILFIFCWLLIHYL